jgi:LPS sulfotransferase NodH
MKPRLSYTIWFSQRTGSTLLCKALQALGMAGNPGEWLLNLPERSHLNANVDLQEQLWKMGSTANGIFGLKYSFHEPHFSETLDIFRTFRTCPQHETNRARLWEYALPNHKHIYMTRRNKVRLAVSWWRAIKTEEWHRLSGVPPRSVDLTGGYSFDAIHHLYRECSMREAGIQEFLLEGNIVPLTIVYEDFIQEYEKTVRKVLEFLALDATDVEISPPALARTADDTAEEWIQRFRDELQSEWKDRGW